MDIIGLHLIAKRTDKYDPEAFMIYKNVLCRDKNTCALTFKRNNLKGRSKY